MFFKELAQKGNALYNVMTDIISRLSNPALGVPESSFQTILSFLIQLIQKDRQIDSLVEKLCLRFQTTSSGAFLDKPAEENKGLPGTGNKGPTAESQDKGPESESQEKEPAAEPEENGLAEQEGDVPKEKEAKTANEIGKDAQDEDEKRQWRDLAFCLSLLPFNSERSIRRLLSHLPCYADKIAKEPQVYNYFLSIVANTRKASKAEMKVSLDELEQKIEECVKTADEDGNVPLPKKAPQTPARRAPGNLPKSAVKSARRPRKPVASSSGSDFESDDDGALRPPKSVQRKGGRSQKPADKEDY
ncbi:hypothetical protein J437_LFUL018115 [Ladona fulva]|uniref:Condensin complex subunit 1 C-terminal domain-containing protein n=1 Tax=Ladona fulva TaxID=123851 RepID=A0A8K0KB32_LADFU|nr:hypothetical protein J437_LFUL018115 [Ladona fulva]